MTKQNVLFVTVRQTPIVKESIRYRTDSFLYGRCLMLRDE
ncbi:hypothetical protein ABIA69_003567 [Lysinibacillus parviboronicapiens]|uniref:Uncharacterized protein n=1 Tax=Lysinibacillus parviboronicapiens TaxID=436516 RepID=A0ABV2PN52_9BACI